MRSPTRTSVGTYLARPVDANDGSLAEVLAEPPEGEVFAEVMGAEVDVVDVVGQLVVDVVVDVGAVVEVVVEVVDDVVVDVDVVDDVALGVSAVVEVVDVGVVVVVVVVDVGVPDVVVDVGGVVEVVDVDVVVEVEQFGVVVEVVVDDVVAVPVLPVFATLAVSPAYPAVGDAPAPLLPTSDASATTAPTRVRIRSALTLRVRNLTDHHQSLCHECLTANKYLLRGVCPEGHQKMNCPRPDSCRVAGSG